MCSELASIASSADGINECRELFSSLQGTFHLKSCHKFVCTICRDCYSLLVDVNQC